jgi:ribonuclease VapC
VILDSSAIIAVVCREPGFEEVLRKLDAAPSLGIGTPTLVESATVLEARLRLDGRAILERLLQDFRVTSVSFGDEHWREATRAFRLFGRGRHPASLNFGDCLTYAVARLADRPLLCVGNDFEETDLAIA